ncbi:MAG: insulinase family protein [Dysgonamonadaceae bacterium]
MKKKLLLIFVLLVSCTIIAQQNNSIPIDPKVRTGKLDNGLTYYIRQNKTPENRADFYIAQRVGSMQEEENQRGLAHFLEHMAFNGTENFPNNNLLNYLQNNGVKFGTNINAYTSFDQTVYYLTDVPTQNKNLLDSCLLILHDWSTAISLDDNEIEKERGVIREEWRTNSSAQMRIMEELLPSMYVGSRYANRMPIGLIDVINNFKSDELRAYYHKWYRSDLQGVTVVGDIDVNIVEQKIKNLFSNIKLEPNAAKREYFPVPENKEPIIAIATDSEAMGTQLMVFYKHEAMPEKMKNTQAGYISRYMLNLAASMINQRFNEILQKPNSPFTSAYAYDDDFFVAKTIDAWNVVASCAEDKVDDALAAIVRETERMKRHGFTVPEYEMARTNILKSYEDLYNNRDKQKNSAYSQEYIRAFTDGEPIPGIEYEYQLIQAIAPNIPVEVINQVIQQLISDKDLVIGVTGPEKDGLTYPSNEAVLATISNVRAENIEPYLGEVIDEPLIIKPPTPGKIVKKQKDEELDATIWTLSNGMKVLLKNTDFKDDEILMTSTSIGGSSQYMVKDPINSNLLSEVMTVGGVGNFSATDIPKVLTGKTASASPSINLTTQNFNGSSSIIDFETMLQLVYLYFTAPRKDVDAFTSWKQRKEIQLKNLEAEPMITLIDSINYKLYGDNLITRRLKLDDLQKVDYDIIMEMYKQQFANPVSFTFTFVGNIDETKVKPVIEQYLASLPGLTKKGEFVKIPLDLKKGRPNNVFQHEMQNPKASVFNAVTGTMKRDLSNTILMSMLDQILEIVYTEKIREEEGGTYGVSTMGSISRYPENQTMLQIIYDTDPSLMEKLNDIVFNELNSIANKGPQNKDFNKVKEYMNKKYTENLKVNSYWLNVLATKYFYNEDIHSDYLNILNTITEKDVQKFTKDLLIQGNIATVVMMPKETVKTDN